MSETINCHECGHSINEHGTACRHYDVINPANWIYCQCKRSAQDIATAAIAEAWRSGMAEIMKHAQEIAISFRAKRVLWDLEAVALHYGLKKSEIINPVDEPATAGERTDAAYGNLDLDGSDNTVAGEMRNAGFDGGML